MRKQLAVLALSAAALAPAAPALAGGRPAIQHLFHRGGPNESPVVLPPARCHFLGTAEVGNGQPDFEFWITKEIRCNGVKIKFRVFARCVARFHAPWTEYAPWRYGLGSDEHNSSKGQCVNSTGHVGLPVEGWVQWLNHYNRYTIDPVWDFDDGLVGR